MDLLVPCSKLGLFFMFVFGEIDCTKIVLSILRGRTAIVYANIFELQYIIGRDLN